MNFLFSLFQSGIGLMGFPADVYVYGSMMFYFGVGIAIANFITAYTLVPLFHPLRLVSVNQVSNPYPIKTSGLSTEGGRSTMAQRFWMPLPHNATVHNVLFSLLTANQIADTMRSLVGMVFIQRCF